MRNRFVIKSMNYEPLVGFGWSMLKPGQVSWLGVEVRGALVVQLSATLSSNGWMAEWSKAADSRNPFLPHQK